MKQQTSVDLDVDTQRALDAAKQTLADKVLAGSGDDDARILTNLMVFREGNPRTIVFCGDAHWLVTHADVLVSAFEATKLMLSCDTFRANQATNPEGVRWTNGEMQRRQHEPAVRALLTDCLSILIVEKPDAASTKVTMITQAYAIVQDIAVRWIGEPEVWSSAGDAQIDGGFMPDMLTKAIHVPFISVELSRASGLTVEELDAKFGMTTKERHCHQELAALTALTEFAKKDKLSVAFLLFYDEEEIELARASLTRIPGLQIEVSRAQD